MSDWREKVKAAHDMVSALCKPRGSHGAREWIMSIPARPDYDPDLVITFGLMAVEKRIKELEAQLAACAAGPWRTDVENAPFVDQQEYWLEYTHPWYSTEPDANYRGALEYVSEYDHFTHPCHGVISRDRVTAFAVPNPPQKTGD